MTTKNSKTIAKNHNIKLNTELYNTTIIETEREKTIYIDTLINESKNLDDIKTQIKKGNTETALCRISARQTTIQQILYNLTKE